jgi:hypothetical protein
MSLAYPQCGGRRGGISSFKYLPSLRVGGGGSAPCGSYSPTGGFLVVGAAGTDGKDAGVGAPIARTQLIKERTAKNKILDF